MNYLIVTKFSNTVNSDAAPTHLIASQPLSKLVVGCFRVVVVVWNFCKPTVTHPDLTATLQRPENIVSNAVLPLRPSVPPSLPPLSLYSSVNFSYDQCLDVVRWVSINTASGL